MDHLQSLDKPSQTSLNNQIQNSAQVIRIQEKQLNSLIASYYDHMTANNLNEFSFKFSSEYSAIQQQLIEVVQMRKDMEKVIELDLTQQQHFSSMRQLIQQNLECQRIIRSLALKIKHYQSKEIAKLLESLQQRLKQIEYSPNICLSNQIKMLATQISRSFLNHSASSRQAAETQDLQAQNNQFNLKSESQDQLNWIIKEQNEKYQLIKSIYGFKFREITIRDELISQRQTAFFDYSASNHELIDALLRQKEREKNLNRTQRQKFQELLKARHQIELQNEHLNFHENNLVSYYEVQLIRLKQLLNEKQNLWNIEKQLLMSRQGGKSGEIQALLSTIKHLTKQKDELSLATLDLKQLKSDFQAQNKKLNERIEKLQIEKKQIEDKMESLQSQLNQNILKLSQGNRNKTEITHKFQETYKKLQETTKNLEEAVKKLQEANKNISEYQDFASMLKNRVSFLQQENDKVVMSNRQISAENESLKQRGLLQKKQIAVLEQKNQYLQDELTSNFIVSNAQIKKLQEQVHQKIQKIAKLQEQSKNHLYKNQQELMSLVTMHRIGGLNTEEESQLKGQLGYQIQRQSMMKQKLLDQAIERISKLLY